MKRFAATLTVAFLFLVGFGACTSLPTAQKAFTDLCPTVNAELAVFAASPLLPVASQEMLKTQVIPANQAICSAGGQLNLANLKAFHDSLLPAAILIVQAVPAIPNQPLVLIGLQTMGPLVQQLIDQVGAIVTAPQPAAPASAPAVAAPAPVA